MTPSDATLKTRLTEAMKAAMRAGEKERLGTIRLMLSEIKQIEVDTRTDPSDAVVIAALDKMCKQRRESISQFESAGRQDLVAIEQAELAVIQTFLPAPLSTDEIEEAIAASIAQTGASGIQDMGKVMALLKPKLQGRADMGRVSALIKQKLSG